MFCIFSCFFCGCEDPRSATDKIREEIISQFEKEMKKKDLYAVGTGGGCKDEKINLITVSFDYPAVMDLQLSRELIVTSLNVLIRIVNSNPRYSEHFEKYPVSIDIIHLCVVGRKSEKVEKNYVRTVSNFKGIINYRVETPKIGPYKTVHEETYEEAKKIVSEKS